MTSPKMAPAPRPKSFNFSLDPDLSEFAVPAKIYIADHPEWDVIATGSLVFAKTTVPPTSAQSLGAADTTNGATPSAKILLLQRAAHDSKPLHWEVPGGAVDPEDKSILHGLARELWEEAGLLVTRVVRRVGIAQMFRNFKGQRVAKYTFEVEVVGERISQGIPEVVLDPQEHANSLWVTQEELQAQRVSVSSAEGTKTIELDITSPDQKEVILEGFRLRQGEIPRLNDALESIAWE